MPSDNITVALDNLNVAMADTGMLAILLLGAVGLTFALFHSRNPMLGFPSAILWMLLGGWSYGLSSVAWDFYFLLAFASLLGMSAFCMFAAYGLRTKKEELAEGDEYIDEGKDDVKFIDEGGKGTEPVDDGEQPSAKRTALRDRAAKRRSRY